MVKCHELKRLPKTTHIASINFRRTTPGSVATILLPTRTPSVPVRPVDPAHPAAQRRINDVLSRRRPSVYSLLPRTRTPDLGLCLVPMSMLQLPEIKFPDPPYHGRSLSKNWETRVKEEKEWKKEREQDWRRASDTSTKEGASDAFAARPRQRRRIDMSLQTISGKKSVHKSAVLRSIIMARLKTAISLIVTRGADVEGENAPRLVFRPDERVEWIMEDWTYVFYPQLSLRLMSYTTLVPILRGMLITARDHARKLESTWMRESLVEGERGTKKGTWTALRGQTKKEDNTRDVNNEWPTSPREQIISANHGKGVDRATEDLQALLGRMKSTTQLASDDDSWSYLDEAHAQAAGGALPDISQLFDSPETDGDAELAEAQDGERRTGVEAHDEDDDTLSPLPPVSPASGAPRTPLPQIYFPGHPVEGEPAPSGRAPSSSASAPHPRPQPQPQPRVALFQRKPILSVRPRRQGGSGSKATGVKG